ncbi:MAG: preprotein translocase subunit YajC [Spirochaetales bacterium]|nr:MAG: preprotein translocase subunit YajC [Spirochaetales bacterium]
MNNVFSFFPMLLGVPGAGGASGGGGGSSMVMTFVTFGLVIVIFYFLIIQPQNKKKKDTENMLKSIQKNDRVVTVGGIRGKVISVKDDAVIVQVDETTKLEFSKSAIAQVLERREARQEATEAASEDDKESK